MFNEAIATIYSSPLKKLASSFLDQKSALLVNEDSTSTTTPFIIIIKPKWTWGKEEKVLQFGLFYYRESVFLNAAPQKKVVFLGLEH